ncbi:ribonuclease III [Candidatus Desantisbacteria bacterium CG1_02_38_46]|uniref:Ribonuclease 3 n=1 Tax=Candidatus Desantisbacteria bacterium CG1_02_38_46 TaxID=1817893 RepID=A0A1J4SDU0_9BACT|nr:MAG: ribonuclease III [Candidatus Desantisbacteria bacterium CG1_02_38_46]
MDEIRRKKLEQFQNNLGIRFRDIGLLDIALTHRTFAVESSKIVEDNERLEFLGDAVLGLAIGTYLYRKYRGYSEGHLSMARSKLVNENILAMKAREFHLGNYLLFGKGEELTGGRNKDSILASSFEAIIGAIYLESGFQKVYSFIYNCFKREVAKLSIKSALKDYKGELQELAEGRFGVKPFYKLVRTTGPDHKKFFEVKVVIRGKFFGVGKGGTKKEAEQKAAKEALRREEGWIIF